MKRQILGKLVELAAKIDAGEHRVPGIVKWNMFAGGTGAEEGKHGYQHPTPKGNYHIFPVSNQSGRHKGYQLYHTDDHGVRGGGLWQDLGIHSSPAKAAAKASAHFHTFAARLNAIHFDDRRRNDMGQYAPNETEGIDPNSMAAAYGPPAVQPVNPMSESHLDRIKRFFGKRRDAGAAPAVGQA
jgi:hypothetical protein